MNSPKRTVVTLENGSEYVFVQEKGQKKYGPPPGWLGPPPPKGCEIFIGKLPRTVSEEELIYIFASVGTIYEFRLMVDFSRSCRGYAFATYTNKEDAEKAVKKFDSYVIRPHRHIGVCKSINNCKLFLKGIPNFVTEEMVMNEIRQLTSGVVDVKVCPNCYGANKNLGVAFVDYENHRAASIARRVLIDDDVSLFGDGVTVDWADPLLDVATLYIRNVPFQMDENTLYTVFSEKGKLPIRNIEKKKNCAFICYFYREDAERSFKKLNGFNHEGWLIKISWAKLQLNNHKCSENNESSVLKADTLSSADKSQHFFSPPQFFNNPIQMLKRICLDNGWGLPFYHIIMNKASRITPYFTYSATVLIPNLPHIGFPPRMTTFFSPYEAKCDAAVLVLNKLWFENNLNTNSFGLVDYPLMNLPNVPFTPNMLEWKENDQKYMFPGCHSGAPVNPSLRSNSDSLNLLATAASLVNEEIQFKSVPEHFY